MSYERNKRDFEREIEKLKNTSLEDVADQIERTVDEYESHFKDDIEALATERDHLRIEVNDLKSQVESLTEQLEQLSDEGEIS